MNKKVDKLKKMKRKVNCENKDKGKQRKVI